MPRLTWNAQIDLKWALPMADRIKSKLANKMNKKIWHMDQYNITFRFPENVFLTQTKEYIIINSANDNYVPWHQYQNSFRGCNVMYYDGTMPMIRESNARSIAWCWLFIAYFWHELLNLEIPHMILGMCVWLEIKRHFIFEYSVEP